MEIRNRIIGLRMVKASELKAHPDNWRVHPASQRTALTGVLQEVGWVDAVLHNVTTGNLLDGRLRKDIAGDTLIPVLDVELSEAEERLILATFDPITALAEMDAQLLDNLLQSVETESEALQDLLANMNAEATAILDALQETSREIPAPRIDQIDALVEKWQTAPGQVWEIPSLSLAGQSHRLMCGDSTNAEQVRQLMNGQRAVLFATDPPYLVDYTGTNHPTGQPNKDWSPKYRDYEGTSGEALYDHFIEVAVAEALDKHAAWYCWHASRRQALLEAMWEKHGAFVHQQIIWAKSRTILTHGWYLWGHEPCFFGWRQGYKPKRIPHADQVPTVWNIASVPAGDHPTIKPIEIFTIPMQQHTARGDLCYEPFSGSGTQLAAGEQLGRLVYAMEIERGFVAVALERLAEMGLSPRLCDL